jgi:tRNA(fMet)-specific endonuclease VapC
MEAPVRPTPSTWVKGILPLESPTDACYAKVRLALEKAGSPIGANDTLIAAHAIALGLTLATDNRREFERVPGLDVANWLER